MEGEMNTHSEHTPATVPLAKQAGDARSRWSWVKPCVWTDRMLAALETARPEGGHGTFRRLTLGTRTMPCPQTARGGVKGDKWFGLYDKVFSERNLLAAFQRVASKDGEPGVDHVTVTEIERQMPEAIWELSDRLKSHTYQPQAIRRVHIPKPGTTETRPLAPVQFTGPTVRDRIVQGAVVSVIEPIFERCPKDEYSAEQSYGFRPGRGCQEALRRVHELLFQGCVHVVDVDLKGYFDSRPPKRRCPARPADGTSSGKDRRWPGAAVDRIVSEGGHSG